MKSLKFKMETYQQLWGEEPHDFEPVTVEISEFTLKDFASKMIKGHVDLDTIKIDWSDFISKE